MILVDYRERGSGVPELLRAMGVEVELGKLEVGDYLIDGTVCIERKSCDDFLSSIVDRRLFEQARLLVGACERPIVIVEGEPSAALAHRRIGYPQFLGAVAALVDMGVSVVFTRDRYETAEVISEIHRLCSARGRHEARREGVRVVERPNRSIEVVQLNMLASIPGISRELAHRILMHFKTPRRFFKASPSALRRVSGLGRARVAKIIEVLDTVHSRRDEGSRTIQRG